jgi:hypothetical protein
MLIFVEVFPFASWEFLFINFDIIQNYLCLYMQVNRQFTMMVIIVQPIFHIISLRILTISSYL